MTIISEWLALSVDKSPFWRIRYIADKKVLFRKTTSIDQSECTNVTSKIYVCTDLQSDHLKRLLKYIA